MDIKYLEEYLKMNPADQDARRRLDELKDDFVETATMAGYVD